jgi:carbonic anhydrase/acetyltransferase-like protein (isoleucine patch superfamily)
VSIHPSAFIHETAVVLGQVTLGPNVSIWPTAVVRADTEYIEIGDGSNIQDGAVIHCDEGIPCSIGKRVTVGHRAVVHGALVQDDCLIGIGAIVLNKSVIGRGSLVGSGAVVTESTVIPPDSLVLGVPARVVRQLTPELRERVAAGHLSYIAMKDRHRAGEFPRHR